jgi:hypothetical protein
MAPIAVVAEALEATATRLQAAGARAGAVAASLHSAAADPGDAAVAAGLQALVDRLGQTVPALVRGHDTVAASVSAAASQYRLTDADLGRLMEADVPVPRGVIGQAAVPPEQWGTGLVPESRDSAP